MTVVMEETHTFVTWPSRLKIGAKSKKDPHIKIAGRPDDVRMAKEKIMEVLDTRQSNRVTMKLDVSYTDHSHIIGKGGLTIKRVMEETGCHIHFPDSNRSNSQEKSNQVSIAGEMAGVERARARVRNLTPLIFSFELPIMGPNQPSHDITSPYVVRIQEKYNVQVMFRTRPKLHATLVVVKGCEWEVSRVKEATVLLIHHMCEGLANQIQVQTSMEISPQHHAIVLGKQSINLKTIMQRTATQIMFPDAGDPNIPSLKKSNVIITGVIHNVYLARQHLIGSLPLVLMFDLPEETVPGFDTESIGWLMQSLDVFINVKHKPKQSTLSVIVKGIERNASNIYEARKRLLGLDEPRVLAEIPATYHIPNAASVFRRPIYGANADSSGSSTLVDDLASVLSVNTQTSPYCLSPVPHSASPSQLGLSGIPMHWGLQSAIAPVFQSLFPRHYPHPHLDHLFAAHHALHNDPLNQAHGVLAREQNFVGPANPSVPVPPGFRRLQGASPAGLSSDSKENSSVYSSLSSVPSAFSSPALSPRNVSPVNSSDNTHNIDLSNMLSDLPVADRRAPGCEKKSLGLVAQHSMTPFDYERKKMLAAKAVQTKPNATSLRVPTSAWVGYGLSQSIPTEPVIPDISELWKEPSTPVFDTVMDLEMNTNEGQEQVALVGMASNYMDHTPTTHIDKITTQTTNDLATMLINIGLEKYIQINKRSNTFSAAPGAERKSSISSTSCSTSSVTKCNLDSKW